MKIKPTRLKQGELRGFKPLPKLPSDKEVLAAIKEALPSKMDAKREEK